MARYFILKPASQAKISLLRNLITVFGLEAYDVVEIVSDDPMLDPILTSMAEYVVRPPEEDPRLEQVKLEIRREETAIAATQKEKVLKAKKAGPVELCPECGRMQQMTKRGYCKICAMMKAREAKNNPHPHPALPLSGERKPAVIVERDGHNPEHFPITHMGIKGRKLG